MNSDCTLGFPGRAGIVHCEKRRLERQGICSFDPQKTQHPLQWRPHWINNNPSRCSTIGSFAANSKRGLGSRLPGIFLCWKLIELSLIYFIRRQRFATCTFGKKNSARCLAGGFCGCYCFARQNAKHANHSCFVVVRLVDGIATRYS